MQGAGRITTHDQLTCAETMKAGVLQRWRSSEKDECLSAQDSSVLLVGQVPRDILREGRVLFLPAFSQSRIVERQIWALPMAASSHLHDVLPAWQKAYF